MENKQVKKAIYENWKAWAILIVVAISIIAIKAFEEFAFEPETKQTSKDVNKNTAITTSTAPKITKPKVTVIDFSAMEKANIESWCNTNKVKCNFSEEYSDIIEKGLFISQSEKANNTIYQGDKITIVYSLGKEPTKEQKNALKSAETYANKMHMSKKAVYNQLISEYGEQFSKEAAQYAIDNLEADWNNNALETAKTYQNTMHMSKKAIYKQLISEYGEKFTKNEAQYAIDNLED